MNELLNIQELHSKFEIQLKEKGLSNMIYQMKKGGKTLVSYSKATLEQLAMDLGLRKRYKDKSIATGKGVLFVAELDLIDTQDRLIASAIGYANTEESAHFKSGGGEQDTLRLGAIAQKRALGWALTPILIRNGLDYVSMAQKVGQELAPNAVYETTSNVEDLMKQQENSEFINVDEQINLDKYCKQYIWVKEDIATWFENQYNKKLPIEKEWKPALYGMITTKFYKQLCEWIAKKELQVEFEDEKVSWD